MPKTNSRAPSYRHLKPSGQAVVTLDGRNFYLGLHGSEKSRNEYDRMIAEWLTNGRRLPATDTASGGDLSVNEMLLSYLGHVDGYYVKNGKPTVEPGNIRLAIRPLRQLYGNTPARDFGPLGLKAVRKAMIDAGLCRIEINRRIGRLIRAFKWAVSEEMAPSASNRPSRRSLASAGAEPTSGSRSPSSRSRRVPPRPSGRSWRGRSGRWWNCNASRA